MSRLLKFTLWAVGLALMVMLVQIYFVSLGPDMTVRLLQGSSEFLGNSRLFLFLLRVALLASLLIFAEDIVRHLLTPADEDDAAADITDELVAHLTRRFRRQVLFVVLLFEALYWLMLA